MKKIILINSPVYDSDDKRNFLPLGICYLAAALRSNGYDCDILDANLDYPSIKTIVEKTLLYDMIGISSNTINFPNAILIAEAVKKYKNIPIILGGHHPTFEHENIIKQYSCFDVIVRGEGETAIVKLCNDYFQNGHFTEQLKGVTYSNFKGHIIISDTIILEEDVNSLSIPVRDNQDKYPKKPLPYENDKLYVSISTSRGCPYGCSFCSVTSFRSKWVARDSDSVAEEAYQLLKKHKDIFIVFADDNFYIEPERSKDIIKKINEKCRQIIGFSFATRADQILKNGPKNLEFFKNNGCYSIELGVENGSNKILNRFCKHTTSEQNRMAIQMIRESGIYVAVDYILFDPDTSLDELKENVEFMKSANIFGHYPPLLFNRVKSYPGTLFSKTFNSDGTYFKHNAVNDIFECLQKYKDVYHKRVNKIMDIIETKIQDGQADKNMKADYIWLKMLPYNIFEKLIYCNVSYYDMFSNLLNELEADNHISYFELKYNNKLTENMKCNETTG